MQEEVLSLLKTASPKKQQSLEKIQNLSFSLLYGTGSCFRKLNVPTSEGKVLMETYFKTFPELAAFFNNQGKTLKFNYVREPYFEESVF
jgi:DNA polymerase I-like protein with 3'-5' exonuclease and polymerase domains